MFRDFTLHLYQHTGLLNSMSAPLAVITGFMNYFNRLADRSQDVFWFRGVDFESLLYISASVEQIWGIPVREVMQNPSLWHACVHPEDRESVNNLIKKVRAMTTDKESVYCHYRIFHHKDGAISQIYEEIFPFFDAAGSLIGYGGIARDVTDERQRMADLGQATYFFRLFAEKMHAVFWVRDESLKKQIYVSPGYEKIWKRTRKSLYENPDSWMDTIHSDDKNIPSVQTRFQELDETGLGIVYEKKYRIMMPDGVYRWIKDTSFPIQDNKSAFIGFAGIAEDITKEVEYEKALREAKETAEVANKAKSDFLAMVSHELRTPLNAILGMGQILKAKDISSEVKECVDVIIEAGNNLLSLVSDVLDFARLEAGKLNFTNEPFDLALLFQRTMKTMQYLADEKQLTLQLIVEPHLTGMVMGDPDRVRQVLINLVTNAIKFTDAGRVTVHLKSANLSHGRACFDVVVEDTGIGIPEDKLETIFEKFSQVDSIYQRKHGGIGLGLVITRELIQIMGGDIEVKSELGKGSMFHFTLSLPLQTEQEMQDSARREALFFTAQRPQFGLRVLLVEDNRVNQRIATMILNDFGCTLDIANNAEEVFAHLEDITGYDLIFMDVGLPDMSGFDIARRLREEPRLASLPIIAMTAHVLEADCERAFAAGMNKVVAKPISYESIRLVLEAVATQRAAST